MENPISNPDRGLYGLVLAGGKSSRMGRDKALIALKGTPQIDAAFALLSSCCSRVFVSIRAGQADDAGRVGKPQIHDRHGSIGPIDGILSALETYPDRAWLVVACDLPFLDGETLAFLARHRNPQKLATAFLSSTDRLPEPLCAIYEPAAREALAGYIAGGMQCPRKFLIRSDYQSLSLPHAEALANTNTPEELERARGALGKEVRVQFFAMLREERGRSEELVQTLAATVGDLYGQLGLRHPRTGLKVAVNNEFVTWDRPLCAGDLVMFIPPTAGG